MFCMVYELNLGFWWCARASSGLDSAETYLLSHIPEFSIHHSVRLFVSDPHCTDHAGFCLAAVQTPPLFCMRYRTGIEPYSKL